MRSKRMRRFGAAAVGLVAGLVSWSGTSLAQKPPRKPAAVAPPTRSTDLELDPDAKTAPPPEAAPLPPVEKDAWGVGGKEQEGEWAPGGQRKKAATEEKQAEAAEDATKPAELPPPGDAQLDTVFGFGGINVVTDKPDAATKVTVISLLPSLSYRFGEVWTLGLRVPISTGSTTGPLGPSDKFNQFAVGNTEILVRPSFQLTRDLRLPVQLAFYLPTASGQYVVEPNDTGSVARAIINQAAASSRGWEDNALFAPKRISLTPGAGLTYDHGSAHVALGTKLELMIKAGGNDPKDAGMKSVTVLSPQVELHSPVTNWVTAASFFYDLFGGKLTPGLRAWLAVNSAPITDATIDYSGPQFVLEPDLMTRIPLGKVALHGGVGGILPIGGHLGGGDGGSIGGLRLRLGLAF